MGIRGVQVKSAVAPRAGAWIEAGGHGAAPGRHASLPVRERGLKLGKDGQKAMSMCRSPCGSVD